MSATLSQHWSNWRLDYSSYIIPADPLSVDSMLGHRLRRWPSIEPAEGWRLRLTGVQLHAVLLDLLIFWQPGRTPLVDGQLSAVSRQDPCTCGGNILARNSWGVSHGMCSWSSTSRVTEYLCPSITIQSFGFLFIFTPASDARAVQILLKLDSSQPGAVIWICLFNHSWSVQIFSPQTRGVFPRGVILLAGIIYACIMIKWKSIHIINKSHQQQWLE